MKLTEFVVVLRAVGPGDEQAVVRRLRAALKLLLRAFRLRCVSIQPAAEPNAQDALGRPPAGQHDQRIGPAPDAAHGQPGALPATKGKESTAAGLNKLPPNRLYN